jgi:surface polysaccharide O-acyltransferase-like enzyme
MDFPHAIPHVNWLAVLVSGIVIFVLGGLWYSPVLFAKKWVALMGKTEAELKAGASGAAPYVLAFLCALVTSFVLAIIINHFPPYNAARGIFVGVLCWVGFAAPSSFGTAVFSGTPKALWAINTGYNLVSFAIAGAILAAWR